MSDAVSRALVSRLTSAYFLSRCLHAIAELGVADALGERPQTAEELAELIGASPNPLRRVLVTLARSGIFELHDNRYAHTAASRLLRRDHPESLHSLVRFTGANFHWRAWEGLTQTIRAGHSSFSELFGCSFYQYLRTHPSDGCTFNEAMTSIALADHAAIADAYDFSDAQRIVDLGGGTGQLLRGILRNAQNAEGILFDLPEVVEAARRVPTDRLIFHAGNFFEDKLPSADIYLLTSVLHNWSDEESIRLLRNLRRSMPDDARLLVIELLLSDRTSALPAAAADVHMLVIFGGCERTQEQFSQLLAETGFDFRRTIPTATAMNILEAVPRGQL